MSRSGPVPLLLDTHYWIWLQAGSTTQIGVQARAAIDKAASAGNLLLSVISIWELGVLEAKGRIRLNCSCEEWVRTALSAPGLTVAAITPEIAIESSRLPGPFHADPADCIIVATARRMGAKLLTRDDRILEYGEKHHVLTY